MRELQALWAHRDVIQGTWLFALAISLVQHCPTSIPRTPQDWWKWIRESVLTSLPLSPAARSVISSLQGNQQNPAK